MYLEERRTIYAIQLDNYSDILSVYICISITFTARHNDICRTRNE